MEFGVLGPVRVTGPAGAIDIGGARQRRLLAALLLHAGEVTSTDRVLDIVFDGVPPAGAATTIRSYVARLRKALNGADPAGDELIETAQGGYALRIDTDTIDANRFEASIETARRQLGERDPIAAAATLRQGLALWRGDAYGEFAYEDWALPESSRLAELRAVANEELNEALLASGLAHDVVSATRSQIADHPLRERPRAQHMLALYRAGRQVEALRSLDEFQEELIEVGLEPSDELIRLGRSIAAHDPALRLDSPAGQPLRGYRVGGPLGEGAHGVVYRAVQPGVGREVAVKTIRAQLADDPQFVRRFDAEAQLVANLEHPHIVPIYDYWREPGGAYIVMRLLADNLGTRLADGPVDVAATATIARQLGSALATAHRAGVVHGDIKPSNVLVDDSNVYLADFGVATLVESTAGDDAAYPSSGYESPELLIDESPTPASDQFALAVLIVHLLTGQLPFGTRAIATPHDRVPSVHVQRPSVPATVDDVLWKATAWEAGDRYPNVETFIDQFEAAITGRAEPAAPAHELTNPYRGLRAFTEVDQAVFFGRDAVVGELVEQLGRADTAGRFVVAVGASGSGKSSIVRAGLLPKLRSGEVPGSEAWLIATMMPGSDPFRELDAALRSVARSEPEPSIRDPDESEVVRLIDAAVPADQPLLLVIDQLEELFTQTSDESVRRHFLDGISSAIARPDSNLRIVATMRADFLDRPLRYSDFGQLVKHGAVTVVGMSAAELESAITRPAASLGVDVEPALSAQLVADVLDQPAALPLLQFTLTELFERRSEPVLTLQSYRDLGGVDAAVAQRADAVFGLLDAAERERAQQMFLRLVTVDESRTVSRRRTLRSDLTSTTDDPAAIDAVIDAFGASRLLTFDHDPDTREPTVEIAHEALISQWPRFDDWVASTGEGLRIQGQLTEAARTWDRQGRDVGDLYRGLRLESAHEWSAAQSDALSELERAFLDASIEARSAEVIAQREQSERDRRSNRRLRGLLAGVGVLLAVALIAGALAIRQQQRADDEAASARDAAAAASLAAAAERDAAEEAERQTDVAVAAVADADLATLISRSAAESSRNPELSLLLALEAQRRAPGPESQQAVLNALGRSRIPNRIATFPRNDTGTCPAPLFLGGTALVEYTVADGRLMSLDLTTGELTDHGPAIEECGAWLGDPATNRVVVQCCEGERTWIGTFDDPYAIEAEHSEPRFLIDGDRGGNVALFAALTDDGARAVLVDATTGEQIGEPIGRGNLVTASADPSGSFVAVSSERLDGEDAELFVLDAATGEEIFARETALPATRIDWDPTTLELIAGMADGSVMTVDLVAGDIVATVPTTATAGIYAVRIRPDGLIVTISNGQIEVVDRRSGPTGVAIPVRDIVDGGIRDDGTVVTLGADGVYDVIDVDGNALVERSWPVDPIARVAFNDGKAGVSNVSTQTVSVIDLASGEQTEFDLRTADGDPFVVDAVYPESDGVWGISADGSVTRWEGSEIVEQFDFPAAFPGTRFESGTRFGDLLAAVGPDADGNRTGFLASLEPGAAGILFAVDAPDGYSAHPSLDGGIHVLDEDGTMHSYDQNGEPTGRVDTGAPVPFINTMDPTTGVVALASAINDTIVVVDPSTGSVQQLPERNAVANLGFARDGQLLVITGFDGTVTVWDLERNAPAGLVWDGTGVRPSSPSWYDPATESIWVYTSARLLEIPLSPERWVERACDIVGRDLTADEWERFVPGDEPVQSACV